MKSHILRALSVGAALLIPVGGLAVLGTGVAGATGGTKLISPSKATLAGASIKLTGVTVSWTSTTAAWTSATTLTITSGAGLKATVATSQKLTSGVIKIKSGTAITIKGGATNNCVITINKAFTLTNVSSTEYKGTKAFAAATITFGASCATGASAAKTRIPGNNIVVTETD